MIGVDTNILVRIFVADDEAQMLAARGLLAGLGGKKLFLSNIVLVEFVWVVVRTYKHSMDFVVAVITEIMDSDEFEVENASAVTLAIEWYSNGKADFSDCLIFAVARLAGASELYSFDRDAVKFIPDVRNLMEENRK